MKLKNKKTGEIKEVEPITIGGFRSLAELNEEWEDYEEPKEYWCITGRGNLHYLQDMTDENDKDHREIGNYFGTREEAEKSVEKLKAWKRLKDKGFRFEGFGDRDRGYINEITIYAKLDNPGDYAKDLELLFGGDK